MGLGTIEDLKPIYCNQKSFYSKARIIHTEDKIVLISYNTEVAEYDKNTKEIKIGEGKISSKSTKNHINEFVKQIENHWTVHIYKKNFKEQCETKQTQEFPNYIL